MKQTKHSNLSKVWILAKLLFFISNRPRFSNEQQVPDCSSTEITQRPRAIHWPYSRNQWCIIRIHLGGIALPWSIRLPFQVRFDFAAISRQVGSIYINEIQTYSFIHLIWSQLHAEKKKSQKLGDRLRLVCFACASLHFKSSSWYGGSFS